MLRNVSLIFSKTKITRKNIPSTCLHSNLRFEQRSEYQQLRPDWSICLTLCPRRNHSTTFGPSECESNCQREQYYLPDSCPYLQKEHVRANRTICSLWRNLISSNKNFSPKLMDAVNNNFRVKCVFCYWVRNVYVKTIQPNWCKVQK